MAQLYTMAHHLERAKLAAVERRPALVKLLHFRENYPVPPLQSPIPCNPPPLAIPPPPGETVTFIFFLVNMYCVGLCCPSALRMALHCFPITSNQSPVCIL